jgi:hypothetical protein
MAKQVVVKKVVRGFPGFRKPETLTAQQVKDALERMGPTIDGHYIYWTGNNYNFRRPSLRSNALRTLTEKRRPISLKAWIQRSAHAVDANTGYDPQRVREGLRLHQVAKPCVYFELVKDDKGNFVAANDIPNPDGYTKAIKAGTVIIRSDKSAEPATNGKKLPSKGKPAVIAARGNGNGSQPQPSSPPAEVEHPTDQGK